MESFRIAVLEADGGGFNYYVNTKWYGWSISRSDALKKAMFIVKQVQGYTWGG